MQKDGVGTSIQKKNLVQRNYMHVPFSRGKSYHHVNLSRNRNIKNIGTIEKVGGGGVNTIEVIYT